MLVDGPVQVRPPTGDLDVGLIGEPAVTGSMPAEPCRFDELGSEALDPAVHSDMIDGKLFRDVFQDDNEPILRATEVTTTP